jgi:hypothetical protein
MSKIFYAKAVWYILYIFIVCFYSFLFC